MDKARSNTLAPLTAHDHATAQSAGAAANSNPPGAEKRKDERYPVSAAADIFEARSRTRLSGRAADISLSGCYVDAINLFPVGTAVGLRLAAEARTFECEARVIYSVNGMGMGFAFMKVSASQTALLRNWIAELAGNPMEAAPAESEVDFESAALQPASGQGSNAWRDVVQELVSVLQRKGILSESEANTLRSKTKR
jgi:hypothetical protein